MAIKFKVPDWVESLVFGDGCGKEHKPDKNGEVSCDDCAVVAGNHTFHRPAAAGQPDALSQVEQPPSSVGQSPRAVEGVMDGPQTTVEELVAAANRPRVVAAPAVRAHAGKLGVDLALVQGTGKNGAITKADVTAAADAIAAAGEQPAGEEVATA